jgi:integrase
MPKAEQRSWTWFKTRTRTGRYGDGGGLYLQISAGGGRSWAFRYMHEGRSRQMGLGPADLLSLAEARERAREARRTLKIDGLDPLEVRRKKRQDGQLEAARGITFEDAARRYIADHEKGWRSAKSPAQWKASLEMYAFPILRRLPVSAIDLALVLQVLEPIWRDKPETASRIRGRIERILDWSKVRGFRTGDNPARWRGHLDNLLSSRRKLKPVEHYPALSYRDIPAFMAQLRAREGVAARALEWTILTAVRHGQEARWTHWDEMDLQNRKWTVPASRMKGHKLHTVPISERCLAILAGLPRILGSELVFPGSKDGQPISEMPIRAVLSELRPGVTIHGMRSSFRDWAAETTNCPNHVVEMALAHTISNAVESSYRRGDLFEKRRELMEAWAAYCGSADRA